VTARDDYPVLAAIARGRNSAHVVPKDAQHALDEIDELRKSIEELTMLLYEATYHS
jgi:hypothetical protein